MKDLMAVVAGVFGRRYTQKQKTSFMNYIGTRAQEFWRFRLSEHLPGEPESCRFYSDRPLRYTCQDTFFGSGILPFVP